MLLLKYTIYHGSFLVFPFLVFLWWASKKYSNKKFRLVIVFFVLLSVLFTYSRFIEPQIITSQYESLVFSQPEDKQESSVATVAIFSDVHLGLYKGPGFMRRAVEKINKAEPDVVVIPGDFIYEMDEDEFDRFFASLADISAPVYAVAGNHDSERPGRISSAKVREKVGENGVKFIDNAFETIVIDGKLLKIYGLSDFWEGRSDVQQLKNIRPEDNTIVIIHNPDAVYEFPNYDMDLVVAGHTHGGQIRIPWVYKYAIPTEYSFDRDWYDIEQTKLFITSGLGEIGLPMRLLVPPEVVYMTVFLW